MAGVLQYALSLKTGGFNSPLAESERQVGKFEATAARGSSALGGIAAAAAGAGAVLTTFAVSTAAALAVVESYAEFDGLVRGLKTIEGTAAATEQRIALLRDVAKLPGLGFEEAVRGDIRLRAVGISADLSEKSLRAFGNAIATVGGGKAELDGVLLALTQMAAKGKVSAEEINQIGERVPQVRAALKAAFGTADSEALQQSGISAMQVIERLVAELAKLPQVTGGARNVLDNYNDSWKELKTSATEFSVGIAGDWINSISGAFNQATRDLQKLKDLFGVTTPGLEGRDGESGAVKEARQAREAREAAAKQAAKAEIAVHNENVQAQEARSQERAAVLKAEGEQRVETEKKNQQRILAAQESVFEARLSAEANLQRRIDALRAKGPTGAAAVNDAKDLGVKAKIAERTAELATLEKQLADIKASGAKTDQVAAEAARSKAEAAAKELTSQQNATALFNLENDILAARVAGNGKLEKSLERQSQVEQLKLDLMRQQGLSEAAAAAAAEKRIALEEQAARPRRRGLLDEAASQARRLERRSKADADGALGNTDRLALANLDRRRNRPLTPARAAEALARGDADPGKVKREERAAAKQAPDQQLLRAVKDIADKFSNLATA